MTAPDDRAVRSLLDAYWSSAGWRPAPQVAPEDFDHAVRAGIMFRDTPSASHNEVVGGVLDARAEVTADDVTGSFLASLPTRRLDLRSALGSYVLTRHLEAHAFVPGPGSVSGACAVCGTSETEDVDRNVLNFERFRWGGVRRDDLTYVWLDLRQFARADHPSPTSDDRRVLARLLDELGTAAPDTTAARAAARPWPAVPSNKAEREVLLDILGICSVLRSPEHPGFLDRWVPAADRVLPPLRCVERAYPVCWWRAAYGVDRAAARDLQLL